jgi:hypothetical protein
VHRLEAFRVTAAIRMQVMGELAEAPLDVVMTHAGSQAEHLEGRSTIHVSPFALGRSRRVSRPSAASSSSRAEG